jgi:hypothetical protein
VHTFTLLVLANNGRVRQWLARLGAVGRSSDAGVITFHLPLSAFNLPTH